MTIKQLGGIFGRNPTFNDVDVEGTLTVGGTYTLPTTDGTIGQVLTTDGAGAVTFSTAGGGGTYTAGTGLALTGTVFSNTITNNNQLTNGAAYVDNAGVDTHLNTGTATTGEVLSWTGTDYDWIAAGGGSALELYAENPVTPTAPSATGNNAVALGDGASATHASSTAIGASAATTAINQVAVGAAGHTVKISTLHETVGTITTGTIDLATGNVFADAPAANATYVFSNPAASGLANGFTLKITPSATVTITWPASVDWAAGTAPDAPASGATNVYAFYTQDGGTTYYGFLAGGAMA